VEEITSAHNPLVKLVRSLVHRKHREETGLFVAEGLDYAGKAKAHRFKPHLLFIDSRTTDRPDLSDIVEWCAGQGARIATIPNGLMQRISGLSNPQPVLLVCHARWLLDPIELDEQRTVLALHEIRDPGNLGTIMRTAEANQVARLLLLGDCCDPYAPEAVRASAGSIFAIEIARLATDEFLHLAAGWSGDIVGTHLAAADSYRQSYRRPVLLLMGSESSGLTPELTLACTRLVRIPKATGVESLNLAIATALMLYEIEWPHQP
jgi:RNA methyltransferase, TrmH family